MIMIVFYSLFTAWFLLVIINCLFKFKLELGAKIIWTDNTFLLPMEKIRDEKGYNIGLTNKHEKFTYRIQRSLRFFIKFRYYRDHQGIWYESEFTHYDYRQNEYSKCINRGKNLGN